MRKCKAKGGLLILMGFLVSYGGCTVRMGDEYSQPQNRTITRSNRRQFMWKKFDELMAQGRFEEAVQEANRLLNSFGDYDKGYNNRAVAYQSLKQYDQALADFNKAILLNSQDTGFYYNRGGLYVQIEKYDFAVSDFNKTIEIDPAYAHGHFGLGLVHNGKGQYDQAITHFEKAISLDPSTYYFYSYKALAYALQGRFDEAVAEINKSISLMPRSSSSYKDRAYYYFMKGLIDVAIKDAGTAIEISPDYSEPYVIRGAAHWIKGMRTQAVQDMKQALKLDSNKHHVYFHLGYFQHELGQNNEAQGYFSRAKQLMPDIIRNREIYQNTAAAQQIRDFWVKEIAVAKIYLQGERPVHDYPIREEEVMGEDFVPSEAAFFIESVRIQPNPVSPDGKFDLVVEYTINDPFTEAEKVDVLFGYSISKAGKPLFEKEPYTVASFNTGSTRRIDPLIASKTKGKYTLKVFIRYQDKTEEKSATLEIK